jgi:N-acetylmuramoyl-L-alanine amidase
LLRVLLIVAVVVALASASADGATGYRVRRGDTLSAIALEYHTTVATLERLNGIPPDATLLAGSTLRLPAPRAPRRRYTVRAGDTLSGISVRFGVSLGALATLNRLQLSAPLPIGLKLTLPQETLGRTAKTFSRSTVRGSILYWARHYGVDPRLATALAWMESGFNNELVSSAGAVGVMQITPDTWSYVEEVLLLGRQVPHTVDGNVRIGVALLHHLLHVYGGDERPALAAYYQGARALQVAGFLPGTTEYVADILALKSRF